MRPRANRPEPPCSWRSILLGHFPKAIIRDAEMHAAPQSERIALAGHPLDEAAHRVSIRRIEQRHAVEARLIQHRRFLAEGPEAGMAVVIAHAAGADAADRELVL